MPTLDFKGKQFVYAHHLTVPFRQLKVVTDKSVAAKGSKVGLDDNLIIHGDNLHALKALLPKYAGRIKCIYIDPPYNTGTEGWCYNDKVNSPLMQEWLKKEVNPVDKEDLERHDKWLSMMWPRLQLLKELLADDGAIFISIDDNEQASLKLLMDEIFGEFCFVASLPTIMNLKGNHDAYGFVDTHEYTLVYTKQPSGCRFGYLSINEDEAEEWLEDEYGPFKRADTLRRTGQDASRARRPKGWFPIFITGNNTVYTTEDDKPKNSKDKTLWPVNSDGAELSWTWSKNKINNEGHNLVLVEGRDGLNVYKKQRPSLGDLPTKKPKSIFYRAEYSTSSATALLKKIFSEKIFDYPKPYDLVKDFIQISSDKDSIILDSFAGSGTTAHAVLALNNEDGGNRKFILVECEDYADKITAERVRRVIKGVDKATDSYLRNGLGGGFSYCELGEEINIENLLKGKSLPSYEELAAYAFYTATGQTLSKVKHAADYFIGETDKYRVHLVYKPDVDFMRSNDSALNMPLAERISKAREESKKTALVFASQKFMGQKELTEMGVTFCQLPYALHRMVGN